MDATFQLTSVLLSLCSILLAANAFFIKNLISKVERSAVQSNTTTVRMDLLERQVIDVKRMSEDVAVLKYAILGHLKKADAELL